MATMDPGGKQIKTADEFAAHVMEVKDKLVVVDFFAAWCTPCQRIIPGLQELQTQFPNVVFCKVDIDENVGAAEQFSIKAVPTFILFKNTVQLERLQGANIDQLRDLILRHRDSPDML